MRQDIFLLLLLLANFACLYGQATSKENFETAPEDRNIGENVTKSQNPIDAASEERLKWGNLLQGLKRRPKVTNVLEKNPSFAKTLNKDPELTMKVMKDPEVSKLKESLTKDPSKLNQPSVKKQIRRIAVKNINRGDGLSASEKFYMFIDIVIIVLISLAITAIPIGGGIAVAKALSGER